MISIVAIISMVTIISMAPGFGFWIGFSYGLGLSLSFTLVKVVALAITSPSAPPSSVSPIAGPSIRPGIVSVVGTISMVPGFSLRLGPDGRNESYEQNQNFHGCTLLSGVN